MTVSNEDVFDNCKDSVDVLASVINAAIDASERFLSLNLHTAQAFLSDAKACNESLAAASDFNAALSAGSAFSQPFLEKAISYSRRAYEISAHVQEQFVEMGEERQADLHRSAFQLAERVGEASPLGGELAKAVVSSAIGVNNSVLDTTRRVADPVVTLAENSVEAFTGAAVRAAKQPPTKKRRA